LKRLRKILKKLFRTFFPKDTQTPVEKFGKGMILVSFPKSGRTWLIVMLNQLGIEIPFTHDGTGHFMGIHLKKLLKKKNKYKQVKVIFLVREPRDVIVSGFFHSSKRIKVYSDTISKFIRDHRYGMEKILTFYNIWNKNKSKPAGFHLVRYEDLKKDAFNELKNIITFLGIDGIEDAAIKESVEFASFDNMQKLEKEGFFKEKYGRGLTPGDKNDIESYKVRKGKIGGYSEYLSQNDMHYCKSIIYKMGNPFYPDK